MRRRNIFIVMALILGLFAVPVVLHYQAKSRLEAYKRQLIATGEKLTIAELVPQRPEGENGADTLLATAKTAKGLLDVCPPSMRMIQPGKAQAGWERKEAVEEIGTSKVLTNLWPLLATTVAQNNSQLAEMRKAMCTPAFYLSLDYNQGIDQVVSHLNLPALKQAELEFRAAMLYQLHEGLTNQAFENLMAAIALPRVFNNEPLMINQLVRYADISLAFDATWAALQYDGWTEAQLVALQDQWERIEILPAAATSLSMERAMGPKEFEKFRASSKKFMAEVSASAMLNLEEDTPQDPVEGWLSVFFRQPRYWMWKWFWSYNDEMQMMKYWQEGIGGIKIGFYKEPSSSNEKTSEQEGPRFPISKHERGLIQRYVRKVFQPLTQAQMVMTAIALKRFQKEEGKYPATLQDLVPKYLKKVPMDYMDGKPLRYRLNSDGTFLVYSVGQNGTDEGGDPTPLPNRSPAYLSGLDWVWPQRATEDEVAVYKNAEEAKRLGSQSPLNSQMNQIIESSGLTNPRQVELLQKYLKRYAPEPAGPTNK